MGTSVTGEAEKVVLPQPSKEKEPEMPLVSRFKAKWIMARQCFSVGGTCMHIYSSTETL